MATQARAAYRALLAGSACVHPASVFDPISARIAADLGYACAMLAGSTASLAVLGAPDIVVLTLTEFADLAGRITRAADIPLMVDADHGYGNAHNVMRTVGELARAGVAACTIEDTDLPQPFGAATPRLVSREEAVGKVAAGVAAAAESGIIVIGRIAAAGIAGIDEAAARAALFSETGAQALFFTGLTEIAELQALRAVTHLPFVISTASPALADPAVLAHHGVRVALRGHQPIAAAIEAVRATMVALRDGTPLPRLADSETMAQVTRAADYAKANRAFLGL